MLVSWVIEVTHVYIFPVCAATYSKSCWVHSACISPTILNASKVQYFLEAIS